MKIEPQPQMLKEANNIYSLCLENCMPKYKNKLKIKDSHCISSCSRKVISGLDFLLRLEKY